MNSEYAESCYAESIREKAAIRKKVIFVGDGNTSKTATLMRYANNEFPEVYIYVFYASNYKSFAIRYMFLPFSKTM